MQVILDYIHSLLVVAGAGLVFGITFWYSAIIVQSTMKRSIINLALIIKKEGDK